MLNDRLAQLTDYPFQRLTALLDGIDPPAGLAPISFSIGEPRHAPPPMVAEIVAAHAGEWNRYPQTAGSADLRGAIADWLARRYALPPKMIDAERNILPVAGTREALFMAALVCVPGVGTAGKAPVVLAPNPLYQVYAGAAAMAGAELHLMPTSRETGFLPDLEAVPEKVLARTALAYVCSPSNPEGAVASAAQLETALRLARTHGFTLAFDQCYADIYDRTPPPSIVETCAAQGGDLDGVLVFHSLSKRSSVPGLRSGFVAGPQTLIDPFKRLRAYAGATTPLPLTAAAAALWRDETHVAANRALYREKFDIADEILGSRFGYRRPAAGFYLWLEVGDGEAAARRLWREAALRVLPGAYLARDTAAGNPGHAFLRLSLVEAAPAVRAGLSRLATVL